MSPPPTSQPPYTDPDWEQFSYQHNLLLSTKPADAALNLHQTTTPSSSFDPPTSHPVQDVNSASHTTPSPLPAHTTQASFGPSNSLQPPSAASPTFSFDDYLTPEFSSENPYSEHSYQTTPNADELWQDDDHIQLKSTYSGEAENLHSLDGHAHDAHLGALPPGTHPRHQPVGPVISVDHLSVSKQALLTPAMSTASLTPERSLHPGQRADFGVHSLDSTPDMLPYDRPRQRSGPTTVPDHDTQFTPGDHHANDGETQAWPQVVSPVVMVSTYNRGDSPARSQVPLSRSGSKRSTSSRLGRPANVNDTVDRGVSDSASMLRPPSHIDQDRDEHDDDDDDDDNDDQRIGVAPGKRNADLVPSINDLERQRELDESRADVEHWLATSAAGSPAGSDDEAQRGTRLRKSRMRSRSAGTHFDAMGLQVFDDSHIPGPGALIDEDSTYYYSDGDGDTSVTSDDDALPLGPQSPVAPVNPNALETPDSYSPPPDDNIAPDELEPLPHQFYRRNLWEDPFRGPPTTEHGQPPTASAAMAHFARQAAQFETASRAATWGTRRRLSEGELESILNGSFVTRHLSLKDTFANRARARGSSFINSAKKVLPGRSGSFIKKNKQASRQASPDDKLERVASPESEEPSKPRDSISSFRPTLQRLSSRGKSKPPKSPPLSTSNALMAMTGQLTAMGQSSRNVVPDPDPSHSPLLGALKRVRSKSDVNKSPKHSSHGLTDLFTKHGGPPVPVLASPLQLRDPSPRAPTVYDDDLDDDGIDDRPSMKMDLQVQAINIIPTLEGFKTHARQLNPRLEPYLIERIGHDQVKRFKKLVKNKVDHARAVQLGKCPSGGQCLAQGAKAIILPPRTHGKDSGSNYAQFKVAPGGESDHDEAGFVEGVVTPALFPHGIPLPPTTHLPAEFECPLCFQVKRFQKPSDWTKHVHEDVQPFSCTFPNCPEPKSFKRKADWVRHENERHRHLEWWKCSVQECNHVCYRKDNFVQHLVREHKMTEPKGKGAKTGGPRARSSSRTAPLGQGQPEFWHLVDSCRHDTSQTPKNEPCKFCGNVCGNWKKLSVHVGKHMEQIAMPVLQLADRQKVSAETVISPVEPIPPASFAPTGVDVRAHSLSGLDAFAAAPPHAPYASSRARALYPVSPVGHSPVGLHAHPSLTALHPTAYPPTAGLAGPPPLTAPATQYPPGNGLPTPYVYHAYDDGSDPTYLGGAPADVYHAPGHLGPGMTTAFPAPHAPRSQPGDGFDPTTGMSSLGGAGYDRHPSPADYYEPGPPPDGHYLASYGGDLPLAHHDSLVVTPTGHVSHGHTPSSSGHVDATMPYYTHPSSGASAPGYY